MSETEAPEDPTRLLGGLDVAVESEGSLGS